MMLSKSFDEDNYNESNSFNSIDETFATPFYLCLILTVVYVVIFIVGVFGNSVIIVIIAKDRKMRSLTNCYFVSLSVADLMIILFCLPIAVYELYETEEWLLGNITCKLMPFLQYLSVNASMLTMLAIALERFVVICLPLRAKFYCTNRNFLLTTLGIWLICTFASLPSFVFSSTKNEVFVDWNDTNVTMTVCYTQPTGQEWYVLSQIGLFYVMPGLFLLMIYALIYRSLSNFPERTDEVFVRPTVGARRAESRRQLNLMIVAVVLSYFLCLLPFNITLILSVILPHSLQFLEQFSYNVLLSIVRVLFFFNSCVNPILYNAISGNFRNAFYRLFTFRSLEQNSFILEHDTVVRSYSPSPRLPSHMLIYKNPSCSRSTNL